MLLKNNPIILFSILTCSSLILSLASCSLPKCKATAKILVKSSKTLAPEDPFFRSPGEIESLRIQTEPIVQLVIDELQLNNTEQEPLRIRKFQELLDVKYNENNNIIVLSYKDSDPTLAKEIVDTLLETYLEISIRSGVPSFADLSGVTIPKANEKVPPQTKLTQEEKEQTIAQYWQEIETMNKNIPPQINLKQYQNHNLQVIEMANSACSKLGYLK